MAQLTQQQKEALQTLKGLNNEEIIHYLNDLKRTESYILQSGDAKCCYTQSMLIIKVRADNIEGGYYKDINYDYFYKEKEKQELALRHKELHMKIINRIRELNDGWRPDFKNFDEYKYRIIYDHKCNVIIIALDRMHQHLSLDMYLKSWELVQQLIDEMSEELIEYLTYENWNWVELPK